MKRIERKTKVVTFEIKPTLLERFDEVLGKKGLGKSETIRGLIHEFIEKNSK